MVLGTTSGAGKSWLTTALCRHYARQGLKVAPFKAQNMSNNARVVRARGRLGRDRLGAVLPGLAARAVPEVRMNPLLLKPEADTHSQVVLMGQVSADSRRMPWRGRSASGVAADRRRARCAARRERRGGDRGRGLARRDQPARQRHREHARGAPCRCALPAGDRHRPGRRLCPPLRHLGAAARDEIARASTALCSTSSGAMPACWRPRRRCCRS
jgi:hypothetical protein